MHYTTPAQTIATETPRGGKPKPSDNAAPTPSAEPELVRHIQSLRRYARVLARNAADADDLVQETLKRALTYFDGARRIDNPRAYLMTILHNVRNDTLVRQARAGAQVDLDDLDLVATGASAIDSLVCVEVIAAIQRLPEGQRQVLMLVGVEELSYREAADVLELPIGTVMSRLSRARTALRALLELDDAA